MNMIKKGYHSLVEVFFVSKKNTIIIGTLVLTAAGFISRFMGFFYRIFLSRVFGEEGVGLYQLIFPVYVLGYSLTTAGIETAISRTVARKMSLGKEQEARGILSCGLVISFLLACLCALFLQKNTAYIATVLLGDERCAPLLSILSYSLPCCAIHSCICGYYYGLKQTKIPALAQLVEQTFRICSVALLYYVITRNGEAVSIHIAVCGLVAGEFVSALFTLQALPGKKRPFAPFRALRAFPARTAELLRLSLPLTANRVLINLLQSIEAVSIPGKLQCFNGNPPEALRVYGVLNGMALPCVLFPSAVTNAVSVMLLPTVAEIQAADNRREMLSIIKKVAGSCFILGLFCCLVFLLLGPFIGLTLFDSKMAGQFIVTLAWICPFLYTNSAFLSIINGLGKTAQTFLINTLGLGIRIAGVFLAIPRFGIQGYLWGLLASQLFISLLAGTTILRTVSGSLSR